MITAIRDSFDLANVLNAAPLTEADATETPRDWLNGIWVAGTVYKLDPEATTETVAVLVDGTAAVELSPKGKFCGGGHGNAPDCMREHWCAADTDSWADSDVRGVDRDWRRVHVWDSNGLSETNIYPTLDDAKAAFDRETTELETIATAYATEQLDDE